MPSFPCSFWVVSELMYTPRQGHTQNEQFIRPHRLCQGLDRGPEPRCPDGGASSRRVHHGPHRDRRRRTLAGRPELGTILEFIHPGETLVVTRIDRLARSMRDLQVIVATLDRACERSGVLS